MTYLFTEDALKEFCLTKSYQRGVLLFETDAVYDTFRDNDTLIAKCEGRSENFYQVNLCLDEEGIVDAVCTCPYDWGGFCKHIVAVALTYLDNPDAFVSYSDLRKQLASLDRVTLEDLLIAAINKCPDGYAWLTSIISN